MEESQYADEVDLIDSLVAFHSEWFSSLPDRDIATLDDYYGFRSQPADLRSWRDEHVRTDPGLPERARALLSKFPGLALSEES